MTYRLQGNCNFLAIPPPISRPPGCSVCVTVEEKLCNSPNDPEVWGPAFWLILFLGALNASAKISDKDALVYWGFIRGIPLMLPCRSCSSHAQSFVDQHERYWRAICSGKETLLDFFIEFQNQVNARTGKPPVKKSQVKKMFAGKALTQITRFY